MLTEVYIALYSVLPHSVSPGNVLTVELACLRSAKCSQSSLSWDRSLEDTFKLATRYSDEQVHVSIL